MELKVLFKSQYIVTAATDRGSCPIEDLLSSDDKSTNAWRLKLIHMLDEISIHGFHNAPSIWIKCVDTEEGIYELKSGKLRLFYFKGSNGVILICTSLNRKDSQKVNQTDVTRAISIKRQYQEAINNNDLLLLESEG